MSAEEITARDARDAYLLMSKYCWSIVGHDACWTPVSQSESFPCPFFDKGIDGCLLNWPANVNSVLYKELEEMNL